MVPFAGLDQLCTGALLALCTETERPLARKILLSASRISLVLFCALMAARAFHIEAEYSPIYLPLVASLGFAWIVEGARREYRGWLGWFLSSPFLSHCGRISFAAFLLHNVTELLLPRSPHVKQLLATDQRFIILVPTTFLLADIAWRFFENPIHKLRSGALREIWTNPRIVKDAFVAPFIEIQRAISAFLATLPGYYRKLSESIAGTTI